MRGKLQPPIPAFACISRDIPDYPITGSDCACGRCNNLADLGLPAGDRLIIDNAAARQPDLFGVYLTFSQLPPEPSKWLWIEDRKMLFPGNFP